VPNPKKVDVCIVGGGTTAGVAALAAAAAGSSVAWVRAPQPFDAWIGESLTATGISTLDALGCRAPALALRRRSHSVYAWGHEHLAQADFTDAEGAWHCDRLGLEAIVDELASARGVAVVDAETPALARTADGWVVSVDGHTVTADRLGCALVEWPEVLERPAPHAVKAKTLAMWARVGGAQPLRTLGAPWAPPGEGSALAVFTFEDGWFWVNEIPGDDPGSMSMGLLIDRNPVKRNKNRHYDPVYTLAEAKGIPFLGQVLRPANVLPGQFHWADWSPGSARQLFDSASGWVALGPAAFRVDPICPESGALALEYAAEAGALLGQTGVDRDGWSQCDERWRARVRTAAACADELNATAFQAHPRSAFWRRRTRGLSADPELASGNTSGAPAHSEQLLTASRGLRTLSSAP